MKLEQWYLTDHICRNCFGRILVRNIGRPNKKRSVNAQLELFADNAFQEVDASIEAEHNSEQAQYVYRCADCKQRVTSNNHRDICCCGIKLKDGTDLGIRCVQADDPDIPLQTEIVAKQV